MFEKLLTPTRKRWQPITAIGFAGLLFLVGLSQAASSKPKPPPPPPPPSVNPAIVYEIPTNNGVNLAIANADGTNQKVILSNGASNVMPSWNPAGDQIVFVSSSPSLGIYRLRINRSTGQPVGSPELIVQLLNGGWLGVSPVWSPVPTVDGSYKIAYMDYLPGQMQDVYLVDPDTKISFNLTQTPDVYEGWVGWSPHATQLVVNHGRENNTDAPYDIEILTLGTSCSPGQPICETAPRQSLVQNITSETSPLKNAYWILTPTWGNTGQEIAVNVLMPTEQNGDVWIIPIDQPETAWNLTDTNSATPPDRHETYATWSPDDMQIVYKARGNLCNNKDRNFQGIVIRNVDGGVFPDGCEEKILITGDGRRPSWWRGLQP